jgi:hypothetical protein
MADHVYNIRVLPQVPDKCIVVPFVSARRGDRITFTINPPELAPGTSITFFGRSPFASFALGVGEPHTVSPDAEFAVFGFSVQWTGNGGGVGNGGGEVKGP